MPLDNLKLCPACGHLKTYEDFEQDKHAGDTLHWCCKECQAIHRARYERSHAKPSA